MKITSFMCVYNDYEYLDQAIESFKAYPDKLYIIEGSWQSSQKFKASPRSGDLVYNILDKHIDNKKVFLITANEPREKDQRNVGLELAKQDGADWCHMLDADEVYSPKSLSLIKKILERAKEDVVGYRLSSYNFINSFQKWYNGTYMRIYRPTPQSSFYMDNDVKWPDCSSSIISNFPGRSFFHYNYVKKNVESFWLKMKYQNDQDPTMWERLVESGKYKEENGFYSIPDDCPIYDFKGKHPAIMKNHPYFKNAIFGDEDLKYE